MKVSVWGGVKSEITVRQPMEKSSRQKSLQV